MEEIVFIYLILSLAKAIPKSKVKTEMLNEDFHPGTMWIYLPEVCLCYKRTLSWALRFKYEQLSKASGIYITSSWAYPLLNKSPRRFLRLSHCARLRSFCSGLLSSSQVEIMRMPLRTVRTWGVGCEPNKWLERALRYGSETSQPPNTCSVVSWFQ